MKVRLAAVVALLFAAAVATPELGLVVHRHAGGDHLHVHAAPAAAHHHPADRRSPGHSHAAHHHDDGASEDAGAHHHHDAAGIPHHHVAGHEQAGDHDHAAEHDHGVEHVAARAHPESGAALSVAGDGWAWHTHWTQPLHRGARAVRPSLAPPQPVARLTPDVPRQRIAAATPIGRSRAPPRIEPS